MSTRLLLAEYYRLADLSQHKGKVKAGDVIPVPMFPIGNWTSAKYPKLPLTRELAEKLIANFDAGVLGETDPVIDSSGAHDQRFPAAAWPQRLSIEPAKDGGEILIAWSRLTDVGADDLNNERYRYASVEIGPHVDNVTGAKIEAVYRGATFTNTPVLKIMPAVLDTPDWLAESEPIAACEPISVALSEIEAAEEDPVATILADMEALAGKLDEALKGKKGIPTVRTFLREIRAKVGAHTSPSLSEPPVGATAEPIGDGASVAIVGQPTPPKEKNRMSELTQLLKLSEDADDALILAEVRRVTAERDSLVAKLAEGEQAERVRALDEAIGSGHIAPAEKDVYMRLAERDPETFAAMVNLRKQGKPLVDLGERGSGEPAGEPPTYENASVELAEKAGTRAEKDGIDYGAAMSLVLAEDEDLRERYAAFSNGKEA